jgi:hypothetical protein
MKKIAFISLLVCVSCGPSKTEKKYKLSNCVVDSVVALPVRMGEVLPNDLVYTSCRTAFLSKHKKYAVGDTVIL